MRQKGTHDPRVKSTMVGPFCSVQSAKVSDQPSPIPPASVVCKQRPVPPPVRRLEVPCVASWATMSFSIAPSRSGWSCGVIFGHRKRDMGGMGIGMERLRW